MSVFASRTSETRKPFDFKSAFGSVFFGQEEKWSAAEAFLGVVMAAATADGHLSPEESEHILNTLHRSKLFKSESAEELRRINNVVTDRLDKRRNRAVEDACVALPQNLRLAAFAHAVDIVLADGHCVPAEAEFLDALAQQFEISNESVEKIAFVLDLKNSC